MESCGVIKTIFLNILNLKKHQNNKKINLIIQDGEEFLKENKRSLIVLL